MNTVFTPEEKTAWREEQKIKARWRVHIERKPGSRLQFSPHRGGVASTLKPTTIRQLRRRNETNPTAFVVGPAGNYMRVDKLMKKEFDAMSPEDKTAFLERVKSMNVSKQEEVAA